MSELPKSDVVKKSLVSKLAEVMGAVDRVAKNGTNAAQGYKFASEADITAAVRSEMASRQIMLLPTVKGEVWTEGQTKSGQPWRTCTLRVLFKVLDGESADTLEFEMIGQGQDTGDKATYKAMTGAVKYALLKLFLIPTGDDPETEKAEKAPPPAPLGATALKNRAVSPQNATEMTQALTASIAAVKPRPQIVDANEPPPISEDPRYAMEPGSDDAPVRTHRDMAVGNYGPAKGAMVSLLSDDQLAYYLAGCKRTLADESKKNFHGKEALLRSTLESELRFRGLPA